MLLSVEAMATGQSSADTTMGGGHKRARPTAMTKTAMAAGTTPGFLAVGCRLLWQGVSRADRSGMAVAVMGGRLLSALWYLIRLPSLISAINAIKVRGCRFLRLERAAVMQSGVGSGGA
jgi:multidrug efflux pump subunit AcrB